MAGGRRAAKENTSAQLTKALRALLRPLRMEQTDLRGLDEPRAVHVCKKPWQEAERQEVCFISIKQAPPRPGKPQRGVRIGGGYHLAELKGHNKTAANGIDVQPELVDKDTNEVIEGIESGQPYFFLAESGDADTFGKGKVPPERMHYRGDEKNGEYHFGTYMRGEARTSFGDRRERRGIPEYDKSVGPDVRECASFRVFSSERRRAERQSDFHRVEQGLESASRAQESMESKSYQTDGSGAGPDAGAGAGTPTTISTCPTMGVGVERAAGMAKTASREGELPLGPAPPSCTASQAALEAKPGAALDALLSAMGLSRKSTVEDAPGKGKQPSVSCTKCRVADEWSVEMCYICMDDVVERIVEQVVEKEVIVEKIVEKIVEVEVPVIKHIKEVVTVEVEVPVERIVTQTVEVPKYIEVEKPETRTMGTQTDELAVPWVRRHETEGTLLIEEPPKCAHCGSTSHTSDQCKPPEAKEIFAPRGRREKLGAVRVGGGFEVVCSVPEVLKKGTLNDIEAQEVLASTKAETMQRMAGLKMEDVVPRRSSSSARARSSINLAGGKENCKEVYGLVRQMNPDRTSKIHRSHEFLAGEINRGGAAPQAPYGHVFGTFLAGSQEKQRFGNNRGSRMPFRVYRSRVTSEDAVDVVPVMSRSHSQPARRPSSAGPARRSGPENQERPERALGTSRSSQALETTAISTIEADTTASISRLADTLQKSSASLADALQKSSASESFS